MSRPRAEKTELAVLPSLIAGLVILALLALAAVAILPARPPGNELAHLLVMHNSLISGRSHVVEATPVRAQRAPTLETQVTGILEGRKVDSWLYRLERESLTVHRLVDAGVVPRNASRLPLGSRRVSFFEVEDLQVLAWEVDGGELVVILGAGPLATLLHLGRWIDTNGLSYQDSQ